MQFHPSSVRAPPWLSRSPGRRQLDRGRRRGVANICHEPWITHRVTGDGKLSRLPSRMFGRFRGAKLPLITGGPPAVISKRRSDVCFGNKITNS